MWTYEKKLQYPVKIKNPNPKLAQVIISQLGGPDGELSYVYREKCSFHGSERPDGGGSGL